MKITPALINSLSHDEYLRWRNQANKVKCPNCGGPKGQGCAFLPGLAFVMGSYHIERYVAAQEAGLIDA